ncbi:hypothetical protein JCM10207_005914 [Rhodosporidiobolus poonsookiae]
MPPARRRLLVLLSLVCLLPLFALVTVYRHLSSLRASSALLPPPVPDSLAPLSPSLHSQPPATETPPPHPPSNNMSAKSAVEAAIEKGTVVVFSKSYCPYCRRAKQLLSDLGADFDAYELDEMDEGADWQNYLASKTGQRTVPQIFVAGSFQGGCSDIQAKHSKGELKPLLDQAVGAK